MKPAGKEGTDYYESYDLDDKKGKSGVARHVPRAEHRHPRMVLGKQERQAGQPEAGVGRFLRLDLQNRKDKHTALKPMDAYALPSHPAIPDQVMQ